MIIRAAEEPEPVGQDFERPLAVHQAVELHALLEDAEDQILPFDRAGFGDIFLAGQLQQLRHRHPLQLGQVQIGLLDLLVAGVGFGVGLVGPTVHPLRQLFGKRHRLAVVAGLLLSVLLALSRRPLP